jgi:coenzyme Q-binding protein COQ10
VAQLVTEFVFDGRIEEVFNAVRQYAKYPEYLPGVTGISVLPAKVAGSVCQVRYELKLIKSFYYTLNMFEERPGRIHWNLDESNIMKKSDGSWEFREDSEGKTKAVYTLDIAFSGLVPQKVVDQLTKANLPLLMAGMAKLLRDVRGQS